MALNFDSSATPTRAVRPSRVSPKLALVTPHSGAEVIDLQKPLDGDTVAPLRDALGVQEAPAARSGGSV